MNKNNYANYIYTLAFNWRATCAYLRLLLSKIRHSIAYIFDKSIVLEYDFYIKDKVKRIKTQEVMTLN